MAPLLSAELRTDFDPSVDFKRFKTYSFVQALELEKSGILNDPEIRERLRNFVAGGLDPRGLREVPRDEPFDLAVRYWVAVRNKESVSVSFSTDPTYIGWGGYPPYWTGAWAYHYEEYVIKRYREGTLIVDLIDPSTKELVWRTFFQRDLSDRVKAYKKLKEDLAKSFAKFPPSDEEKAKMQREREKQASK
jgi:hypothetical protein